MLGRMIVALLVCGWGFAMGAAAPPPPFVAQELRRHVQYLAGDELRGRYPGTEGWTRAGDYIVAHFQKLKLLPLGEDGFDQKFTAGRLPGRNIIAVLRGDGKLAEQAVIVSAHYDGLGVDEKLIAEKKDGIFNGADDDASGTAAMLLVAQALSENAARLPSPRRTIIFIAFDHEEQGLIGSQHYVAHPRWPLEKTFAVINIELIGRVREGKIYAGDAETIAALDGRIAPLAEQCGLRVETRMGGMTRADHWSLMKHRVPALSLFSGIHGDYHQVTDEVQKLNLDGAARCAWLAHRLVVEAIADPREIAFREPSPALDEQNLLRMVTRIGLVPALDEQEGKYPKILFVLPNSPARKAGVVGGDEISALNGIKIERVEDVPIIWSQLELDKGLKLTILRKGKEAQALIPAEVFAQMQGARIRALRGDLYEVTFGFAAPKAKEVFVAGSFNQWNATALKMDGPDKDGRFTAKLELTRGRYEYAFVVDAKRQVDPENIYRGGQDQNNILFVGIKP